MPSKTNMWGDVKKGHVEVVKARGTSEAIKLEQERRMRRCLDAYVDVEVTKK